MLEKAHQTSITGRDGYIINKALPYAIAHIQSLPEEMQECSDMRDMCAIVKSQHSILSLMALVGVEHHAGIHPNLWPEPDDELSHEELTARDEFRAACDHVAETIRQGMGKMAQSQSLEAEVA